MPNTKQRDELPRANDVRQVGYIITKLFGVVDLSLEDMPFEQASFTTRLRSTIKRKNGTSAGNSRTRHLILR